MPNYTVESSNVETPDGVNLRTMIFRPKQVTKDNNNNMAIVLVHPYSIMGGCQVLMQGIASGLADKGYPAVTFDMRGVGRSTGKPSLTGFAEVADVVAVCNWVSQIISSHKILLLGSSAGAPIAGSAVDQLEQVVGYISLGYPFGMMASILFGRHHNAILQSLKPKLFVMGTRDGFTSVNQLNNKLKSAAGRTEKRLIQGVSHFEMEGPDYDAEMVNCILDFIASL
ncbi:hypothetical protein like AT5G19630 [Hibiscus trionum]|uniref:Xaa-Pro dipeptidyl-peptidase-like domain-containing protein n=1 Tax=Hibiscus trionum TaxID=183268 RepID=A0A9W7JLA2_HIBTR|nr:hypothetical protein like AT5G19630 [Hibiscus trionum]